MADCGPIKEKPTVDYTGLKIGVVLSPILLLFIYLGKADMGLTVNLVLIAIVFAVRVHWKWKKHVWFWAIIAFILALHIPLFFIVRLPHGPFPGVFYGMPFAIADYLLISRSLDLARKVFLKNASSSDQNG